jgi:hypothetical protein
MLQQDGQPLLPLRVLPGRVQAGEVGMRQDVDRTIRSSSSSPFAAASLSARSDSHSFT